MGLAMQPGNVCYSNLVKQVEAGRVGPPRALQLGAKKNPGRVRSCYLLLKSSSSKSQSHRAEALPAAHRALRLLLQAARERRFGDVAAAARDDEEPAALLVAGEALRGGVRGGARLQGGRVCVFWFVVWRGVVWSGMGRERQ